MCNRKIDIKKIGLYFLSHEISPEACKSKLL